ncbi:O-antigen polysaccharide polymerase Wzy, partial [Acinetobacter haemolyticus]|uniref:O-antigen polysaccharide polymerase Wzy n=1 Tax=Acinetobacter haemolyticus TaxID=29430 RepID=UPI0013735D68
YYEFSNSLDGGGYLQYKVHHLLQIIFWAYLCCMAIKVSSYNEKISFFSYVKKMNLDFLVILGVYFMLIALSGDRGPIIYTSILFFAGYFVSQGKKLNFKKMFILVCLGAISLQFLGYFRETDGLMSFSDRIDHALIVKNDIQSRGDGSLFPPSIELAQSLRAYHAVIMDQEVNPILFGLGNLGALLAIIPGLGVVIQSVSSYSFTNSAIYITDIMGADHGMGTTALADIYLNYGFWGVLVLFSFFGYFFAKLDKTSYENFKINSIFMQVSFLVFISYAIYIGRATFIGVFSDIVMVWVFVKLASLFYRLKR